MDIRLSCARYGNLEPTAYSVLRSLPDLALKHHEHGLRHPLEVFNISVGKVWKAFLDLCKHLAVVQARDGDPA